MFISKKTSKHYGKPPAILLDRPKFARNLSSVVRLAAAFGFSQVCYSGSRVDDELSNAKRLPREERMRYSGSVELINTDYPFDLYHSVPVIGVDLLEGAIPMPDLQLPEVAVFVFGPEDGSICKAWRHHCHYITYIPTKHCLNLATAVSATLMKWMIDNDAYYKLDEARGFDNFYEEEIG